MNRLGPIRGLLLMGVLGRLGIAAAAVFFLWAAVLWAVLSQPAVPVAYQQMQPATFGPVPRAASLPAIPGFALVAASGQSAPTGGIFDRFDVAAQPIVAPVNAAGQVAFYATVLHARATEGIFLAADGKIKKIAAVGDPVPGGGILSQFSRHPMPALNDAGHVAFGAAMTASRAAEGVFLAAGDALTVVALTGGDAPGVVGGTFSDFDAPALNNLDEVVFVANVRRGRDLLQVLYRWRDGRLQKLVAERDLLPTLGAPPPCCGAFDKFGLPTINNRGVIVFPATIEHGPVLGGIFVSGSRDLRMLAAAGVLAPNGEMMVRFSERVAIDDDDNLSFGAQLGVGRTGREAVLRVNTTETTQIALAGDPAPGGGSFSGFGPWPGASPTGRIAFIAAVENGPGLVGVYAWDAGTLRRIVTVGDRLPDGSVLAPLAINSVTSAGANGGVTLATMGEGGEQRIYYLAP